MSVEPAMYGPPKPSAVDQITSDIATPPMIAISVNKPNKRPIAIAVSARATIIAKVCGSTLTHLTQKSTQACTNAG